MRMHRLLAGQSGQRLEPINVLSLALINNE